MADLEVPSPERPSSAFDCYEENEKQNLEEFNNYDSTYFIQQLTSQDILYESQPKEPKIIAQYVLGEKIGEGSYGKVREGYCSETLQRVAVKIMKRQRLRKIPNGEENVKSFFRQLIEGLQYLHANSVVHRDIKPGNLLLAVDGTLKISDFGVAEELNLYNPKDLSSSSAGTPTFQPPEVASGQEDFSSRKVDVWAAGVTLYHMITGKYPFEGGNVYELYESISKNEVVIPESFDPLLGNLISGMLEKNHEKRLSVDQVAAHPWLTLNIPKVSEVPLYAVYGSSIILNPELMTTDTTLVPYLRHMYQENPVHFSNTKLECIPDEDEVPAVIHRGSKTESISSSKKFSIRGAFSFGSKKTRKEKIPEQVTVRTPKERPSSGYWTFQDNEKCKIQ